MSGWPGELVTGPHHVWCLLAPQVTLGSTGRRLPIMSPGWGRGGHIVCGRHWGRDTRVWRVNILGLLLHLQVLNLWIVMKIQKQKLVINMEERLSRYLNNVTFYVMYCDCYLRWNKILFKPWLKNKIIKSSSLMTNKLGTAVGHIFSTNITFTFLISFCLDVGSWSEGLRRNLTKGLRLIEIHSGFVKVPVILLKALHRPLDGHSRRLREGSRQGPLRRLV